MPLPTPNKNEKEKDFIARCMGDETANKDFKDNKQRAAVCYSQWKSKKKKSQAEIDVDISANKLGKEDFDATVR